MRENAEKAFERGSPSLNEELLATANSVARAAMEEMALLRRLSS